MFASLPSMISHVKIILRFFVLCYVVFGALCLCFVCDGVRGLFIGKGN